MYNAINAKSYNESQELRASIRARIAIGLFGTMSDSPHDDTVRVSGFLHVSGSLLWSWLEHVVSHRIVMRVAV